MATCNKCSRAIKATAKFCVYCGTRRVMDAQPTRTQPTTQQSIYTAKKTINSQFTQQSAIKRSKNISEKREISTSQKTQDRVETRTRTNIKTSARVRTQQRVKSTHVDEALYQLNMRLERSIGTIERALSSFQLRDDYTRSDATLIYKYIEELVNHTRDKEFKRSQFSRDAENLLEKIKLIAIKVFESLTIEIKNQELRNAQHEWSTYRDKIEKRLETKTLLDKLEKQNKIINVKINDFEKIFGTPSYTTYHKSQLFTKFKELRNYYLNTLGPVVEKYLDLLHSSQFAEYFNDEVKILNELKTIADPNVPNRNAVSTHQISKLCFDFLEERGVNASTLRLQLQELEEQLQKNDEKIKRLQQRYTDKMWQLINSEQLGVKHIQPGKVEYIAPMKYQLSNQKQTERSDLNSLEPLLSLNRLEMLKNFEN